MNEAGFSLLDFGNGKRLEQWGRFRLIRPDPTATEKPLDHDQWNSVDAIYEGEKGKGRWKKKPDIPDEWAVPFDDLQFVIKLTPYKHTGIFPEQQYNWQWARKQSNTQPLTILNLFAYTGAATCALAKDGHFVTHVDSAKPTVTWAKENAELNNIPQDRIRWIVEDAPLFAERELKRGKKYDAIILDPPAFGHSPTGKVWKVEKDLAPLLEVCAKLLSPKPKFLILNGYAQHDSPESFHRLLTGVLHTQTTFKNFTIDASELVINGQNGKQLSTGTVARCSF